MKNHSDHPVLRALSPSGLTSRLALAFATVLAFVSGRDAPSPSKGGLVVSITVTPDVVLRVNQRQRFTAVGRDAVGAVVPISPSWSVVAGGGGIDTEGLFTAGAVVGTFAQTVRATSDGVSGFASVIVTA